MLKAAAERVITLYPSQVVTENGRACKAKLGVKRTEAGNCATRQADKLTVRAAERLNGWYRFRRFERLPKWHRKGLALRRRLLVR